MILVCVFVSRIDSMDAETIGIFLKEKLRGLIMCVACASTIILIFTLFVLLEVRKGFAMS